MARPRLPHPGLSQNRVFKSANQTALKAGDSPGLVQVHFAVQTLPSCFPCLTCSFFSFPHRWNELCESTLGLPHTTDRHGDARNFEAHRSGQKVTVPVLNEFTIFPENEETDSWSMQNHREDPRVNTCFKNSSIEGNIRLIQRKEHSPSLGSHSIHPSYSCQINLPLR